MWGSTPTTGAADGRGSCSDADRYADRSPDGARLAFPAMPLSVKVNLDLTQPVTLSDLREFITEADRVLAADVDLREYDGNGDLVGLEALGGASPAEAGQ